jgi:hypothetical protein
LIVMKDKEVNVRRAIAHAHLDAIALDALPFPGRKAHRDQYVDELSTLLKRMRGNGVIRP